MVRRFEVSDLLLIRRLQRRGMWLDAQGALTGVRSPAWVAVSAPLRWRGRAAETYVSRVASGGVIQLQLQPDHTEARIVFVAPAPDENDATRLLWHRLLVYAVQQAGEQHVQRCFANVPERADEAMSLLCQVGFVPFAREDVYAVEPPTTVAQPDPTPQVRPVTAADEWALQELYAAITPQLVQRAEGGCPGSMREAPPRWLARGAGAGFVLCREGEIIGLVRGQAGRAGLCLRLWGRFQQGSEVLALLEKSREAFGERALGPVYCLVREYQAGVRTPLADYGFRHLGSWSCLVKHTTARAKRPAWRAWPVLEPSPEAPAPTAYRSR
jgi:hypothetical protein